MIEDERRSAARAKAEVLAPRPVGSTFTYGLIGLVLAGLVLIGVGQFYAINLLRHPIFLLTVLVLAFAAGIVLRRTRKVRHVAALRQAYRDPDIPGPDA